MASRTMKTLHGIYIPGSVVTSGEDYPVGWSYETREEAEAELPKARRRWGQRAFIKDYEVPSWT